MAAPLHASGKVSVSVAYLMSEACGVNGELIALGGGRVARIVLGENDGVIGGGETIEEVRNAFPKVLSDDRFFFPSAAAERSSRIASLFGIQV